MPLLVGSVDPYPILFGMALVLSVLILVAGLAVWNGLRTGNRGLAGGAASIAVIFIASYLIPHGRRFLRVSLAVAVVAGATAALRSRAKDRRKAPGQDVVGSTARARRFRIGLVVIVAVSALPLVALRVLWVINQEEPLPVAMVAGQLTLTPDQPIAIVDTTVRLGAGAAGLDASISAVDGTDLPYWLTESRTIRIDATGGPTGYGSLGIEETCTDCTYVFRTAFTLDPTVMDAAEGTYEIWFGWSPDEWDWDLYDVESLPPVTLETRLANVDPIRIGSNEIIETTNWASSRPYDLRLITFHADEPLIPQSGYRHWPVIGRNYAILDLYDDDGTYLDGQNVWNVGELDVDCLRDGCGDYSYIVPIVLEDEMEVVPGAVQLWVYHWIDVLDGSRPEGTIELTSESPDRWIESAVSGEVEFTSDGRHAVSFQIDVTGTGQDALGSGVAILTAHADSDTLHVQGQSPRTDSQIRYVRHLYGCEEPDKCEIGFAADGDIGDIVTWTLEYHYGLFGGAEASPNAAVVISDPQITTGSSSR